MNSTLLFCALTFQVACLIAATLSRRVSCEARSPIMLSLLGFITATIVQTISANATLALVSVAIFLAATIHFIFFLAAPKFFRSARYLTLQTTLFVTVLIETSLLTISPNQQNSFLVSFVWVFSGVVLSLTALYFVYTLFIKEINTTSLALSFRAHAARSLVLWCFLLSLLFVFSLPITPAFATATTTWSTCFAAMSSAYIVYERRLFLYDCVRKTLLETQDELSQEAISLSINTLESLGELLENRGQLELSNRYDALADKTTEHQQLPSLSGSPNSTSESILHRILTSDDNAIDQIVEGLISSDDSSSIISPQNLDSQLTRLSMLSKMHFGVEIIGNSPELMNLISQLREHGQERRFCLITGEQGTGKQLIAQALHNLRGNAAVLLVECPQIKSAGNVQAFFSEIEKNNQFRQNTSITKKAPITRDSLVIKLPAVIDDSLLLIFLENAMLLQVDSDVILTADERFSTTLRSIILRVSDPLHLHIPPLRERPIDVILQALWYLHQSGKSTDSTQLKGISPAALRAALISPWRLNTEELFDSLKVALSLAPVKNTGILKSFVYFPVSEGDAIDSVYTQVRLDIERVFDDLEHEPSTIADYFDVPHEFVYLLADRLRLTLPERDISRVESI